MKQNYVKVAVITGATSGIGLAAAELFVQKGYRVYGIARRPYAAQSFTCFSADVRDYAKIQEILEGIYAEHGGIDAFVNNAGFGIAGAMEESSEQAVKSITEVNLTALCILCGKVIPLMRKGGKIINVSSVGGLMPLPYQAMYSATKAGVEIFSRALANELRPRGIKVCCILPGDVKTNFTAMRITEGSNGTALKSVNKMARDEQRGMKPEKVAKVIYKVAKRRSPPLRKAVGFVSKLEIFLSRFLSVKTVNAIIRRIYC